jgi:hypothetical protein
MSASVISAKDDLCLTISNCLETLEDEQDEITREHAFNTNLLAEIDKASSYKVLLEQRASLMTIILSCLKSQQFNTVSQEAQRVFLDSIANIQDDAMRAYHALHVHIENLRPQREQICDTLDKLVVRNVQLGDYLGVIEGILATAQREEL